MKDMLFNKIKFLATIDYSEQVKNNKKLLPEPIKFNVPDWYKNLKHSINFKTVKGCMPFLDTLTTGYVLKLPVDYHVSHNFIDVKERKTGFKSSMSENPFNEYLQNVNINKNPSYHSKFQMEDSPQVKKNLNLPIHKFLNPWTIKTPLGYSCLFLPPMNNVDDRFSILPGIVDTDVFENEINFPFILNGDKYPILETTIKLGTPYVQVIPFKRDEWKMKIEFVKNKTYIKNKLSFFENIIDNYKNKIWKKKKWI
jgi:hypothetical protein